MCGITAEDEARVYYYVLWPTAFLSIHPDYLLVHRLEPLAPDRTRVVCEWLFEADTIARPGFDPAEPVAFWDLTNRQDWHVCELQQRGTKSRSWVAGRYANNEPSVQAFDLMVSARYVGESIIGRMTVRDRYDVPTPKPGEPLVWPMDPKGADARRSARARATADRG
jgi:Rieske 2Fe-2S family protein